MPRINEYTQQTSAQGSINARRATEEDFGYGRQISGFGESLGNAAAFIRKEEEISEASDAEMKFSEARNKYVEEYTNRIQNMQPGDKEMAPNFKKEMEDYFSELAGTYKTDKAREYILKNGMSLSTDLFVRGLGYQHQQAGAKAGSDFNNRVSVDAKTIGSMIDMYDSIVSTFVSDIRNGVGKYEPLKNSPAKEELIREGVEKMAWSAAMAASENPAMRARFIHLLPGQGLSDAELGAKAEEMQKNGASDEDIAAFFKANRPNAAVKINDATYASDEKLTDKSLPQWFKDLSYDKRALFMKSVAANQNRDDTVARESLKQKIADDDVYIRLYGKRPENPLSAIDFKDDVIGWESYNAMLKAADTIDAATKVPIEQGMAMIDALKPKEGELGFAQKGKEYAEASRLFFDRWKEIQKDPIQAAANSRFSAGMNPIVPMSITSPDKWVEELAVRIPQSKAVHGAWGLGNARRHLTNDEAENMGKVFSQMSIDEQFKTIDSLGKRFKDSPGDVTGFFKQIAPGNSGINAAGYYATKDRNVTQEGETRDNVIGYILSGMKAMSPITGKGDSFDTEKAVQRAGMPSVVDAMKILSGMRGFSDGVSPEFQVGIEQQMEVVMAHYVGKQISKGKFNLDLKDSSNRSEFERSVKSVIGEPVKFGQTKVLKPWGMSKDDFVSGVEARVDAAARKPMSGYGLMHEVSAQGDVYRVIEGGIATNIVIDMGKRVAPKIPSPSQIQSPSQAMPQRQQFGFGDKSMPEMNPNSRVWPEGAGR